MQNDQNCALQNVYQISKFATVFACFHSNRLLQTHNDGIFALKSKQQCSLPKISKFVALLTELEISPAHCLKPPKEAHKQLSIFQSSHYETFALFWRPKVITKFIHVYISHIITLWVNQLVITCTIHEFVHKIKIMRFC